MKIAHKVDVVMIKLEGNIDWLSKNKDKWDDTLVVIGWTAVYKI